MKGQVTQLFSGPTSTSENILLFREELLSMPSINYCTAYDIRVEFFLRPAYFLFFNQSHNQRSTVEGTGSASKKSSVHYHIIH